MVTPDRIVTTANDRTTVVAAFFDGEHTYPAETCAMCLRVDAAVALLDPSDPRGRSDD